MTSYKDSINPGVPPKCSVKPMDMSTLIGRQTISRAQRTRLESPLRTTTRGATIANAAKVANVAGKLKKNSSVMKPQLIPAELTMTVKATSFLTILWKNGWYIFSSVSWRRIARRPCLNQENDS